MTVPLFEFVGVRVRGDDGTALDGLDVAVADGMITAIVGPSGSGKTTMLRLCNRLEVPTAGRVHFRGADIATLDPLAHRRRVGMVFQSAVVFGGTVRDNLTVAGEQDDAPLAAALERAELPGSFLDRRADALSGGEAQRVSLARTLMNDPEVLLMDEPTAALDGAPRLGLERLALQLVETGVPILWVTHDLAQARRLGQELILLIDGRVRAAGTAAVLDDAADEAVVEFVRGGDATG